MGFASLDLDMSGTVTLEELKSTLADPKARAHFSSLELDVSNVQGLFKLIDTDESGEVSIDEFILNCVRLKGAAKSTYLANAKFDNKKMAPMLKSYIGSLSEELAEVT